MPDLLPRFYFTVHPGDLRRNRLPESSFVMLVASAFWDNDRRRFRISHPPMDHLAGFCIDSGGFTAARRWGKYPWTTLQYIDFIRDTNQAGGLTFCAVMDYACEPSVNRSTFATNTERIRATLQNEADLFEQAPDLPWLPVLQGDNFRERAYDLDLRATAGRLPSSYAGIGSVCGRGAAGAARTVKFYADHLPGVKYHGFGMHIQALDDDEVFSAIKSWDSYGWAWGRGKTQVNRPTEYFQQGGGELFRVHPPHGCSILDQYDLPAPFSQSAGTFVVILKNPLWRRLYV